MFALSSGRTGNSRTSTVRRVGTNSRMEGTYPVPILYPLFPNGRYVFMGVSLCVSLFVCVYGCVSLSVSPCLCVILCVSLSVFTFYCSYTELQCYLNINLYYRCNACVYV